MELTLLLIAENTGKQRSYDPLTGSKQTLTSTFRCPRLVENPPEGVADSSEIEALAELTNCLPARAGYIYQDVNKACSCLTAATQPRGTLAGCSCVDERVPTRGRPWGKSHSEANEETSYLSLHIPRTSNERKKE